MATLRELYDTDFSRVLNVASSIEVRTPDSAVEVQARVHFDFDANAKYLSCHLTTQASTAATGVGLIEHVDELLAIGANVEVQSGYPGQRPASSTQLRFAGRLFVYHEADIPGLEGIEEYGAARGVLVQFRGPAFAAQRTMLEKPLAFISHDSRDKLAIARPIAIGLSKLMCPVWFDEFSLKVGDRLRESIEHGLQETRKCILILTPNFLGNSGWTKTEFNSIFTRELLEKEDVVLPVWHDVSPRDIYEYSPSLADRVAVEWSIGETQVIRKLHRAIMASQR